MRIARPLLVAVTVIIATAAASGAQHTICQDGTPEPTKPTPTTPAPTTPTPTTPEPTTPEPTTPEPTTPEPTPPTCAKLEAGIYFKGDFMLPIGYSDVEQCCARCNEYRGCNAFVISGPPMFMCEIIFGNVTETSQKEGYTAGYLNAPQQCLFEPAGTKFVGDVYYERTFGSVGVCCGECAVDATCFAYNYDTSSGNCQFLRSVADKTTGAGWISGTKQ